MDGQVYILLIEDNPADSELVRIFLKGVYAGKATLTSADTMAKAMDLIANKTFDVIILDLSLPDSLGLETFDKIHASSPNTPIIVLTGLEDETIGIDAVKQGAQDFLIKGKIKGNELRRAINYSIERHKLVQDLAEKAKELEEKTIALYSEKQKLAEAQKLAHIGSWELNLLDNTISWSDEFFRIHGMRPQEFELTQEDILTHIYPSDRENVKNIIDDIRSTGKPSTFIYRIIRKDRNIRVLHASGEIVTNERGEAIKLVGIGQDITERVQEQEMDNLATAATKSYNSVVITDAHGRIEWVNEGFTILTGYTLDELKQTHGEKLRHGSATGISENAEYFKKVIKYKEPVTYESKNFSKTGQEYWTITTLTPVLDENEEVRRIIAIDSDITIRKQMEEELLRANKIAEHSLMKGNKALNELIKAKKQLEESVRVKEQFLANMSHEIRTPMNAIVGFTDLIMKTQLSPEQKQYIDAIKTSGENLIVIINDILDFSKIQSGKISLEQTDFSLSQVIATLTELMLPKSVEKNIKLSKQIDKKIPDRLIGDPTRLNQILLNLVGNAIKFTDKGEVKINAELVAETDEIVNIKFAVVDTGIGIPKDKQPYIFDAFTQAAYDTTRKYGGTGLGLAIVKQLIEIQGGEIKVDSKPNKGSIFSFSLIYRKNMRPKEVKKNGVQSNMAGTLKKLDVLLVEDNLLNQLLANKVLSDWGWDVEVAENGLVAIEKIENHDFDLVLMDIQLPEMDGYEATRYIRHKLKPPKSNVPVIAMTAHAISGEDDKCFKAGMNGYISKPFNPQNLYNKVVAVLSNGHAEDNTHTAMHDGETNGNGHHKHIDLAYLKKLANGSNEFIQQMITLFIEQTPGAIDRMEKYLEEHNWEALSKVAHKMKPSVMFVGIKEIEKDVKSIEDYAVNETNTDELPGMVAHVKDVCAEAIGELREEMTHLH